MVQPHVPKHKAVENELRLRILRGAMGAGARMPSDADLMREFGCSRGTIRRAIHALVSEGLIEAVRGTGSFVREKPRDKVFAAIVPNILNPDIAHFVSAFSSVAAACGHRLILYVIEQDRPAEERTPYEWECIEELGRMHIAGVVKFPTNIELHSAFCARFRAMRVPCVVVNDFYTDRRSAHNVLVNEQSAAEQVIERLMSLGHRRIGYYTTATDPHRELEQAMEAALAARGGLPLERLDKRANEDETILRFAMTAFSDGRMDGITAIVTPYWNYTVPFYEAAIRQGLRVPEDISLACTGGLPDPAFRVTDFTSCSQPIQDMARKAVDLLLSSPQAEPMVQYMYSPRLHVGVTTVAPPGVVAPRPASRAREAAPSRGARDLEKVAVAAAACE